VRNNLAASFDRTSTPPGLGHKLAIFVVVVNARNSQFFDPAPTPCFGHNHNLF
jgi:hypothetical protein